MNTRYLNTSKHYSETGKTFLETAGPWSVNVNAAVQCPDGEIRKVKRIAIVSDTYFSIPAAIDYKGKSVAGFIRAVIVTIPNIASFHINTEKTEIFFAGKH